MALYQDIALKLARDRGYRGDTFATADELRVDGYEGAWTEGRTHCLLDQATAYLRFEAVPGIEIGPEAQHRVNLAVYALAELRRLLKIAE